MAYSTILKSALLCICFISSNALYAAPATDATVNKFIQLSDLNNILDKSLNELHPYFDEQAEQLVQNLSKSDVLDANELSIALKLSQKMLDMTRKTVMSPKTTDAIKQVVKNIYTEEEIQAYNKFLSTPEGKSINLKSTKAMLEIQSSIENIALQTMENSDYEKEIFKIIEPLTKQ